MIGIQKCLQLNFTIRMMIIKETSKNIIIILGQISSLLDYHTIIY